MNALLWTGKERQLSYKGAVTVYCSLIFLLLAALIGSMLESAHQAGVRVRLRQAADAGMDSLFSMYDSALFETYGLMFLNSGFGNIEPSEEKLLSYLEEYIAYEANANQSLPIRTPQFLAFEPGEITVKNTYYATDDDGIFFAKAILELMKYQETADAVTSLTEYLTQLQAGEQAFDYVVKGNETYENTDWSEFAKEVIPDEGESETVPGQSPEGEPEIPEKDLNQEIDKALEGSLLTQVKELIQDGLLKLFVPDVEAISDKKLSDKDLPSRQQSVSHDIAQERGFLEDTVEQALYNEYLLSYFGSYRNALSKGELSYEIEYVLQGRETDKENLLGVLEQILLIRMGLNLIFLLGNGAYYQQAASLAGTLVGWTGIAALVGAITLLLLAVWAFSESVLDVRGLLAGKKIPFYKTVKSWTSTLENCVGLVSSGKEAQGAANGIGYDIYLRLLLLSTAGTEKYKRSMDVIQWNMVLTEKNFRMKNCIYAMEVSMKGMGHTLFGRLAWFINPTDTYTYQVEWARSY